jgi:YggT family protein
MFVVCALLQLFVIAVFVRVVLSWFSPTPGGPAAAIEGFLRTFTDPVLEPVRRIMPRTGMIDFSPIVVLIGVQLIQRAICG